jgi:hypothetical protein
MNTCTVTQQFFDALIRGTLSDGEAHAVRAHIAACDECREAYEMERNLFVAGTSAPRAEPSPGFAASVIERWQMEARGAYDRAEEAYSEAEILSEHLALWGPAAEVRAWLGVACCPMIEPYLPLFRETRDTFTRARDVLREASSVVAVALKQVLFGRFIQETT